MASHYQRHQKLPTSELLLWDALNKDAGAESTHEVARCIEDETTGDAIGELV